MNALRQALLAGRRRPRHSGAGSPVNVRGDGYEFLELREYASGDDVRRIDWAATARTAQLQTRVMVEDAALVLGCYLDESASMQCGRSAPLGQSAAAIARAWARAAEGSDRIVRVGSLEEALAILPRGAALLAISDFYDCHGDVSTGRGAVSNAHRELLFLLGRRLDCTALIARDPWQNDLPLSGFVNLADAENRRSEAAYFGKRERQRYAQASRRREFDLIEELANANWRAQIFEESDDGAALLRAFGL